jgi:hypothetical protein
MRNLLLSALLVLAFAFTASATVPPSFLLTSPTDPFAGEDYDPGVMPPDGASFADDYWWNGDAWVSSAVFAQSFNSGPAWSSEGFSNVINWSTGFKTTASVAQWVNFQLLNTQKDWYIRQPGLYASDCISFFIQSNNDVLLTFEDFGPLVHQVNFDEQDESINTQIPIWYGFGSGPATLDANNAWALADGETFYFGIEDSAALHNGFTTKMYSKIEVVNCNSSSQYEDEGIIYLTLKNQKVWIDGELGDFVWNTAAVAY